MDGFWIYTGFGIAVLLLALYCLHWFQYASLYLATYKEVPMQGKPSGDSAPGARLSFRKPGSKRPDLDHDLRLLQPGSDVFPLCASVVRITFSPPCPAIAMFLCDCRMATVLWVGAEYDSAHGEEQENQDSFGTKIF